MSSKPTSTAELPALDLLWGVDQIASELNLTARSTYHLLEKGSLPARKHRGKWVSSRPALRRYFAEFLMGAAA
jgi:hypothetical protein